MGRTNFPPSTASTTRRGYGHTHQQARRQHLAQLHRDGEGTCCRCHGLITPDMTLHLDHNHDRTGYLGLAHATCNRTAGAREARRRQQAQTTWTNPNW